MLIKIYQKLAELEQAIEADKQSSNVDCICKILNNPEDVGTTIDQEYLNSLILEKFSPTILRWSLHTLLRQPEGKYTIDELMDAILETIKVEEIVSLYVKKEKLSMLRRKRGYSGISIPFHKTTCQEGNQCRALTGNTTKLS